MPNANTWYALYPGVRNHRKSGLVGTDATTQHAINRRDRRGKEPASAMNYPLTLAKLLGGLLLVAFSLTGHAEKKVTQVTTAKLADITFFQTYTAPATTLSLNESRVSAETSGKILKIPVRVGDSVAKGELLAALDCQENSFRVTRAEAGLTSIEARVTLANQQIKRTKSLIKTSSVSEERLNQQQADLQVALADRSAQYTTIAEARLNQARCLITAPFTGIVRERLAGEGEWINPGQPIIQLIDKERLEISAQISVDLIDTLQQTDKIQLETNQGNYGVAIRQVVPTVESLGRNREVRLQFTDGQALPGSSGRLTWQSTQPYVPADIPVRRDKQLGLFLLDQEKARFHPLANALEGHPARVDLPSNVEVIMEGRQALNNGDSIEQAN
ncbi:MAG: efflux RND transporter periplasmic adaptor subunit [Sedimenticola selenatireducens]|uniref:Efflux RND transporter periplasmic adaptor subunit n=2 Tax=Sedimenticola selenatireducens TaxID=191960 RepID=A0A557SGZ1_9GAMM|nr:efflux RND transporter periplasmic adaptor subunit [Sedimenticola selenatireducens]TVT64065.1 MAG: efflux RND transporter periplasmic adaptor subunit [Sedimenticola selenatireducens]